MPTKIQFEWELPDALVEAVAQEPAKAAEMIKQAAVLDWVRTHKLSLRRAAETTLPAGASGRHAATLRTLEVLGLPDKANL